jgi:hypothetical protein
MPLTLAEYHIRKRLPRRSLILLFDAACLLGWTNIKAIAELAEMAYDAARVALARLEREGWLVRDRDVPRRLVRFRARVAGFEPIPQDRSNRSPRIGRTDPPGSVEPIPQDRLNAAPPTRRTQARDHAQQRSDPDPSLDPGSMDQRVRPSGGVQGGEAATDGRTEGSKEPRAELRNALLAWVQQRHNVEPRLSTPGLMRLVTAGATEHELRSYLTDAERGSHPCFDGVEHANFRFGAVCTPERFAKWRASRARPPRRGPSVSEQLERELEPAMPAPDEMAAIAELVRARLK